jgi:hypothetical protein
MKFEIGGLEPGIDFHHGSVEFAQTSSDLGGLGPFVGKLISAHGLHDKTGNNGKPKGYSKRAQTQDGTKRSARSRHEMTSQPRPGCESQPFRHETVIFEREIPTAPWIRSDMAICHEPSFPPESRLTFGFNKKGPDRSRGLSYGADDEIRTRDPHLGNRRVNLCDACSSARSLKPVGGVCFGSQYVDKLLTCIEVPAQAATVLFYEFGERNQPLSECVAISLPGRGVGKSISGNKKITHLVDCQVKGLHFLDKTKPVDVLLSIETESAYRSAARWDDFDFFVIADGPEG